MDYAIPLWTPPSLPVVGSGERFPVRRIFCVGRNYAKHIIEMGGDPDREAPFFFMKPADAIVQNGGRLPYPSLTRDLHHEVELVLAVGGPGGTDIPIESALDHVFGYGVGIDLTRRDLQGEAKKAGRPWDSGKGFEGGAPCGSLHPVADVGHPQRGAITLAVNGETRQAGDLGQMIWKLPEIIAQLSRHFTVKPGDLIFTGTPEGVGPVMPGDTLRVEVEGLSPLTVTVDPPASP